MAYPRSQGNNLITSKWRGNRYIGGALEVDGAVYADGALNVAGALALTGNLTTAGNLVTTKNVGTAGTNVTAVEYGFGNLHYTILTLAGVAATIGDNAALAGGAAIYTLPAGPCAVLGGTMSLAMSLTTGTPTTDTPELGIGTTVGSGANATLGAVSAACENILGPAVADDIAGTAELLTEIKATPVSIETAGGHIIYANYADTWADVDDTAATLDGTVGILWLHLPLA